MSAEWEGVIDAFEKKLVKRLSDIHANASEKVHTSIKFGSAITGAPGQPVDTHNLQDSYILEFPIPMLSHITTNAGYAPAVEEGIGPHGPMTLQSESGGWHSVKLTKNGFPKIVAAAVREELVD